MKTLGADDLVRSDKMRHGANNLPDFLESSAGGSGFLSSNICMGSSFELSRFNILHGLLWYYFDCRQHQSPRSDGV